MYKLGILTEEEQMYSTSEKEVFNHSVFDTSFFHCINNNEKVLADMNIIFIEEGQELCFESICETILELRKWFEGVVWVFSKDISEFHQMIYFQLGADGISNIKDKKGMVLLQLENLLKHTSNEEETNIESPEKKTINGNFELIEGSLSLKLKDGFEISLTKLEFLVLRELFIHMGETLSYEEIYQKIWVDKRSGNKEDAAFKQYRVTNLIFHLRKKFETAPGSPEYIKTIRSKGYKLDIK